MRFPIYMQADMMDCGPTCLRMIARHYGRSLPLQFLREKAQIGKEGVNLLGIGEAAESIGFRTQCYKLSLDLLKHEAKLPAILHWNQNHFVVLYKISRANFSRKEAIYCIGNPASGLISLKESTFKQHWVSDKTNREEEGVALLLDPSPAFFTVQHDHAADPHGGYSSFNNIFQFILPYKKLLFQLFIGLLVGSLLQLILPFLTQSIVDKGINTGNIQFVYVILLAQLALFAGRTIIEFIRGWILLHVSTRINLSILTDFLIKLMRLPVSFFDSKQTGDILQRMNDHKRIESFLTGSSLNVLFSLINLAIFSFVLAAFNTSIFSVFLFATILYGAWVLLFLKKRKVLDHKRFEVASREQSATIQLVQGMQEIKLNGVERPMRWNWERLQIRLFGLNMEGLVLTQWQQAGAFAINESKNIFITFLSAKAVIEGDMTLGAMLSVQYIIGQLNSPIEQMIGFAQAWQNARISMSRLNEVHKMEEEEPAMLQLQQELPPAFTIRLAGGRGQQEPISSTIDTYSSDEQSYLSFYLPLHTEYIADHHNTLYPAKDDTPSIHLHNLSFIYPGAGNEPVLKDLNLKIPTGKTTAIVGTSGSGKTTLLKLLLKFYQPQRGDIKLNSTPLSSISSRVWRSHCGVVMQESFIFSDSIAKNIAVGQDKIDMERLRHAAELANVQEFIESLPLGYNTKIGPEGIGISMGQRQRILIARAIYRKPDFIFFDEATNSLDANNESTIVRNLDSFFKGRTVVIVAHRLSTVKNADQIVVLNRGRITEKGTHEELVALHGEYYQLIKNQLELGQ